MSIQGQSVKAMLENASIATDMHLAKMKAFHAQLSDLDKNTRIICFRLLNVKKLGPGERELLSEELLGIQRARTKVVEEIKQEAAKHGL